MRIVSLVPSLTETIVSFGKFDALVGRTSYCEEPVGVIEAVESVGGSKTPDVDRILALRPDLVVVNKEENRAEDAARLESGGLRLHVTHPRSVSQAITMLEELGQAIGADTPAVELAARARVALAACEAACATRAPLRTFCPIWRKPWMTFREDTYIGDVLRVTGFANVYGGGVGKGGQAAKADFFEVDLTELTKQRFDAVLLPDEPFRFEAKHAHELSSSGVSGIKKLIDGKAIAWYGPRIPDALASLSRLSASIAPRDPQ